MTESRLSCVEPTSVEGCPAWRLRTADGAEAVVAEDGAHVLSWATGDGRARLYLSPHSRFGPGASVRGGVPVIFPQFSNRGPGPRHGFARTRRWGVASHGVQAGRPTLVLHLRDDEATRAAWPAAFEARLTVQLDGAALDVALAVTNTGREPFGFTGALHTYLAVDDLAAARLHGLQGLDYLDSADGGTRKTLGAGPIAIDGEVDRIVLDTPSPLELHDGPHRLAIHADGWPDTVVWNPGADKGEALADLQHGWRDMLCVEAAAIARPVTLAPGASWAGRQRLLALA